ncbi:MAG: Gfo/Idh/MocA family protein [Acidimicrobiales bacterium]
MSLPEPRLVDPTAVPSLRWGILGPGWIADQFASTVRANTAQRIVAVASQTPGRAQAFASAHAIPFALASYDELVARDDVDAVYVANQPTGHHHAAMLAIDAGKHVLIEKPLTQVIAQAEAVFARARERRVLAMEAMWTRYLPQFDVARQLLDAGAIGEPRLVLADFCQDNRAMERMWRRGDGSPLWDMGIYPIALCQMVFGEPTDVDARGILLESGMDTETTSYLTYESGARAIFTVSGVVDAPHHALIAGEEGVIEFGQPFVLPSSVGLTGKGFNAPMDCWIDESGIRGHAGLAYQVTAFADYVGRGLLESPLQSHEDSLACLRVARAITRRLGATTA